ncbi:hypothetical protein M405DRAFT_196288 [Rhizopogon salebrosus TDB-379]|nr:hypothetical protein M405DRAFT_196288 [Rhizopogon salebrosus TDB-379]
MQYFCDVLDSWLMSRPHPYWMLIISNLKRTRSVMDLCLLHHMQRKYLTFRVWTWDAMDRYQSSYVYGLRATIPAMLKHRLTPPPYSDL